MHKYTFVDISKNVLSKLLIFLYIKIFLKLCWIRKNSISVLWSSLLLLCAHFISVFLKSVTLLTSPRSYVSSSTLLFIFLTVVLFWTSYSAIWFQIIFYEAQNHFCNFVCILSPKQSLYFMFVWLNVHMCVNFSPDICDTPVPLFLR